MSDDTTMGKGLQTNRWLGYHLLKSHGVDLSATDPLAAKALARPVPTDASTIHPISPNQYGLAVAVALRQHPGRETMNQAFDWLSSQVTHGHCTKAAACELNTNSHWHIHGLWAASLLATGLDSKYTASNLLAQKVLEWWAAERYLWNLFAVPRGPRAGQIIGVCGRWSGDGDSDTRDVCASLIITGRAGKGGQYWSRPALDTFASWLVRGIVGGRVPNAFTTIHTCVPTLPDGLALTVEHYTDGHRATSSRPINKQGDGKPDPTCVAVKYSTGEVTTDERAVGSDLGEHERTEEP